MLTILTGAVALYYCIPGYNGFYNPKTQQVVICTHNEYQYKYTYNHESGHYHWYESLTEEQRAEYTQAYNRDKRYRNRFFREYSRTNVLESFADDYAILNLPDYNTNKNKYLKMRISLIKKILKTVE